MLERFKRFSLRPVFDGLDSGLRQRRKIGPEPPDRAIRWALVIIPFLAALLVAILKLQLSEPGALLSAFGLVSSALLSAFALIARWRESLSSRKLRIDGVQKRALDEAVAHILFCALLGAAGAALCVILVLIPDGPSIRLCYCASIFFSAITIGVGVRLFLHFLIVIHLLAEQYAIVNPPAEPETPTTTLTVRHQADDAPE